MNKLFDSDDEDDGKQVKLGVNESYASTYTKSRKGEELQKLQDRYGKSAELPSSSSSSSEDSDADEWTAEHEQQFLRALSDIKAKRIDDKHYFTSVNKRQTAAKADGAIDAPMFLKDYERKIVTERQGKLSEDEDSDDDDERADPTPIARQKQLKDGFKSAVAAAFDDDDDTGEILKARVKTTKEKAVEEKDYRQWLKGQTDGRDDEFAELTALRDYWQDPSLDDGERFLRDYMLNDGHREARDVDRIPTYDEVLDDDEETKMEQFEHKFNFRFEEPDQEFIKQYPRTVGESVRSKDDRRKQTRDAYKDRKVKEKERIRTDLLELKSLKRSAIEDKLTTLRRVTGDDTLPMTVDELDADFDPAEYDAKMKAMFDDKYYDGGDDEDEDGDKPQFSDLSDREYEAEGDEVDDDWDGLDVVAAKHASTSRATTTGKRHRLMAAVVRDKPRFDPGSHTFEEYVRDYYALECEDVVADLRCKFRYRQVPANDFGLSLDEILTADDKELNAWASLRKTSQYRDDRDEAHDQKAYERKAHDADKKKRVLSSVYKSKAHKVEEENRVMDAVEEENRVMDAGEEPSEDLTETTSNKKSRRKRKRNAAAVGHDVGTDDVQVKTELAVAPKAKASKDAVKSKKNKSSRRQKGKSRAPIASPRGTAVDALPDERLAAFGINPKKYKNALKYGAKKGE